MSTCPIGQQANLRIGLFLLDDSIDLSKQGEPQAPWHRIVGSSMGRTTSRTGCAYSKGSAERAGGQRRSREGWRRQAEAPVHKRTLKLIRVLRNAGVMQDGLVSPVEKGTPQGPAFSPWRAANQARAAVSLGAMPFAAANGESKGFCQVVGDQPASCGSMLVLADFAKSVG